ncbi:sec1 family domain-containing protein 1 [Pancytospora epiphaga]|nr:sec1 family domain-containing protein 1 [Pancytospora epiphaga]
MLQPKDTPFKILIIDEKARDILSSTLRVSDLRECGITVHLLVSEQRAPATSVPAVYFMAGEQYGSDAFIEDIKQNRYSSYYLSAIDTIKRTILERFAQEAGEMRIASKFREITDQFLAFSALQEDFYTLNIEDSFIRRGETVNLAVTGLLSIFVTMGASPVVAGDSMGIAEMLCRRIKSTGLLKPSTKKPLLLILDREYDMLTPVKHTLSYTELINDLFDFYCNKVEDKTGDESKTFDVDVDSEFYKSNAFEDFPVVAEKVESELLTYKKELAIRCIKDSSDKLAVQKALENVPHLQRKGEMINTHLGICMRILEIVKSRRLDDFMHMEENFSREDIQEVASNGTKMDVLRLCLTMVGGKNADLIDAILEKRSIKSPLVNLFRGRAGTQGLRERMKSFIFRQSSPLCGAIENVLSQIRSKVAGPFNIADPFNTGIIFPEISQIVVYVHGGVTYSELKEVRKMEKSFNVPVIVGGSEVLSSERFIAQAERAFQ